MYLKEKIMRIYLRDMLQLLKNHDIAHKNFKGLYKKRNYNFL